MGTFSSMISVFFLVFFVSSSHAENSIETMLTESMNLFSQGLFEAISQDAHHAGKNLIMSPMSADIVLAMLSLGAKGKTHDEMNEALHLPNSAFTKAAFKPVIDKMNDVQNVTMHLANKVYVKEGNELAPVFEALSTYLFSSEVENVDFSQSTEAAAEINSWVEIKTNGTIKDIVAASDMNSDTTLVLVNTIYVKGAWEKKFNPYYTSEAQFFVSPSKMKPVEMMFQQNTTHYGESAELDAKILELALEGNEMSMMFVLPNKADGLEALEKKLIEDLGNVKAMVDSLKPEFVTMFLPKFQIETSANLNDALSKLGMNTMFTDDADFGGLLANPSPMKVDQVIQKAFIDVNEEGVTAGDATAVTGLIEEQPNKQFIADHPFCFALVNSDGQAVFAGHFTGEN